MLAYYNKVHINIPLALLLTVNLFHRSQLCIQLQILLISPSKFSTYVFGAWFRSRA